MINFGDVEALSRQLQTERISRERFSLEIPVRDAANGLYAAMKAEVEYRGGSFEGDEATKNCILTAAQWLTDSKGKPGLFLCGLCGNGKTTLARAIAALIEHVTAKEYGLSHRTTMRMVTAGEICRLCALSERFKEDRDEYSGLFNEKMLIIDDLGEEPLEMIVYGMPLRPVADILSRRYARQQITIVTSNLNTDELRQKYGERLYDRFREMLTSIIFTNPSYRR